jgi:hypothetical protein
MKTLQKAGHHVHWDLTDSTHFRKALLRKACFCPVSALPDMATCISLVIMDVVHSVDKFGWSLRQLFLLTNKESASLLVEPLF